MEENFFPDSSCCTMKKAATHEWLRGAAGSGENLEHFLERADLCRLSRSVILNLVHLKSVETHRPLPSVMTTA